MISSNNNQIQSEKIEELLAKNNQLQITLPLFKKTFTDELDYCLMRFTCRFVADKGCRYQWGRIGLRIFDDELGKPVHIHSIAAKRIENIPSLDVEISQDNKINAFDDDPKISMYGLGTSTAMWDFEFSEEGENTCLLLAMLKVPKNTEMKYMILSGGDMYSEIFKEQSIPIALSDDKKEMILNEWQ